MNNLFYSCLDTTLSAPQPEQHLVCKHKANKENWKIVFYGTEEFRVLKEQPFILNKLQRTPNISGVIFFTINQFFYGQKPNFLLMKKIVDSKLLLSFAREDINIESANDLKIKLPILLSYYNSLKRNKKKSAKEIIKFSKRNFKI